MNISFSAADLDILDRARSLARNHLQPLEAPLEETGVLTEAQEAALHDAIRDHRLGAINHAREHGGQNFTLVQQSIVNEEVGATTNSLWAHVWQPPICLKLGTDEQIRKYLVPACEGRLLTSFCTTEPGAGSDAGGIRTTAVRDGDDYVINGEKCFASLSEKADLNLVTTIVDGDRSKPTIFLVDKGTPGFNLRRCPRMSQRSGHEHPELDLVDLRVPKRQMLGGIGQGFELTKDWFVEARLAICARSVGMMCRAVRLATEFAAEREQFGSRIIDFQGIEFRLADITARTMAAKSLLYRVAAELDAGVERRLAHRKVAAAKLFCSETAFDVVDKAAQVFGGRGVLCEYAIERLVRDVRLERIWEGTSDIQRGVIGKDLKRRSTDPYLEWPA